jgi:transcriptional regulator with XRE-family HTH domain
MIDRIKQIMAFYKLSPASFAEQIGINRSNLTHLFSGRNQPSLDLAKKILHSYPEIKTEWMIMGAGEMLRNEEDKEFEMKVLSEKKQHSIHSNPDLFAAHSPQLPEKKLVTQRESPIENVMEPHKDISNSREVEKTTNETERKVESTILLSNPTPIVSKIVFFYLDSSFEVFYPKK